MAKGKGLKPAPAKVMANEGRKNGKARKKNPKTPRKTGRTIGGYSPAKLAIRAKKRSGNVSEE
jgi:hypothetical protein